MNDEFISKVNEEFVEPLSGETITIDGVEMQYIDEHDIHDSEITAFLYGRDFTLRREGIKVYSYDSWVETYWHDDWCLYE